MLNNPVQCETGGRRERGNGWEQKRNRSARGCLSSFKLKIKEPYRSHLESKMLFITAASQMFLINQPEAYYETATANSHFLFHLLTFSNM